MKNRSGSGRRAASNNLANRIHPGDESLETKVGKKIKPQPNGCWIYNGSTDAYGRVNLRSIPGASIERPVAHRFVYEILVGRIRTGWVLHHLCETPGCVNPEHLMEMPGGDHTSLHAELRRQAKHS